MRYENLHPFITVTDCTFEMKVKKYRPNPNPCTHTATPGARLEEPINVPDGDGWGIAKLPTKSWMLTNEQRDNWAGCDSPECC